MNNMCGRPFAGSGRKFETENKRYYKTVVLSILAYSLVSWPIRIVSISIYFNIWPVHNRFIGLLIEWLNHSWGLQWSRYYHPDKRRKIRTAKYFKYSLIQRGFCMNLISNMVKGFYIICLKIQNKCIPLFKLKKYFADMFRVHNVS